MFHKIKELMHEMIDFLSSGESGALKDRNGRIVGVYDGGPHAWSLVRFIPKFCKRFSQCENQPSINILDR